MASSRWSISSSDDEQFMPTSSSQKNQSSQSSQSSALSDLSSNDESDHDDVIITSSDKCESLQISTNIPTTSSFHNHINDSIQNFEYNEEDFHPSQHSTRDVLNDGNEAIILSDDDSCDISLKNTAHKNHDDDEVVIIDNIKENSVTKHPKSKETNMVGITKETRTPSPYTVDKCFKTSDVIDLDNIQPQAGGSVTKHPKSSALKETNVVDITEETCTSSRTVDKCLREDSFPDFKEQEVLSDGGEDLNNKAIILSDTDGSLNTSKNLEETFPLEVSDYVKNEIGGDGVIDRLLRMPSFPTTLTEYEDLPSPPACYDLPCTSGRKESWSEESVREVDESVDEFEQRHKKSIFYRPSHQEEEKSDEVEVIHTSSPTKKSQNNESRVKKTTKTRKSHDNDDLVTTKKAKFSTNNEEIEIIESLPSTSSLFKKSQNVTEVNSNTLVKSKTRKSDNSTTTITKKAKKSEKEPTTKRPRKNNTKVIDKEAIALLERKKAIRPNFCMQYVTCQISENIIDKQNISMDVLKTMHKDVNFQVMSMEYPCVKWTRALPNGEKEPIIEVPPHVYLFYTAEEFISALMETNQKKKKTTSLQVFMKSHNLQNSHLCYHLICFGMTKYKNKIKKSKANNKNKPTIMEIDRAIVKFEFTMKMDILYVEDITAFMMMLQQLTKSIAEEPYKTATRGRSTISSTSNVKVIDGKSANLCWKAMLRRMNNISSDVATAIGNKYHTPGDIIQIYKQLTNIYDREQLLTDITVRRGVGATETNRKVGKEMSKRIHTFFTSTNGQDILL